jgi:xanthine dehydrogenase YagS FAD-binding subunit
MLRPSQFVSHIVLPPHRGWTSGIYEARQSAGPDYPLAAAAAALRIVAGRVHEARIVLGQVAPTPWVSEIAAHAIEGQVVSEASAQAAGLAAITQATPLKDNEYKVQMAQACIKRAILRAAGLPTGGFE